MKRIKSSIVKIIVASLIIAAILGGWGIVANDPISFDAWLQYVGAIVGGVATMLGVFITLDEERKRQKITDRPQIALSLSDYEYENGNYGVYFSSVYKDGRYVADPDRIIPLRITNTGPSRTVIKKITFILGDANKPYSSGHVTFPLTFGSTEAIDVPIKVYLNKQASFLTEVEYCGESDEDTYTRTYNVYVPKDLSKKINITLAANSTAQNTGDSK